MITIGFVGDAALEGVPTIDGRYIEHGALDWGADIPILGPPCLGRRRHQHPYERIGTIHSVWRTGQRDEIVRCSGIIRLRWRDWLALRAQRLCLGADLISNGSSMTTDESGWYVLSNALLAGATLQLSTRSAWPRRKLLLVQARRL